MYLEEKKLGETNIDNVGKILLEAADYIERRGWCQHTPEGHAGKVCAVGALLYVATNMNHPVWGPVWGMSSLALLASARLGKYLGTDGIESWNDTLGRTEDEVVAALRAAARS